MNKNDQEIKTLMDVVDQKEKALGKLKREPLTTNGIFRFNDDEFFNINTVSSNEKLIKAMAFLISREKTYAEACERLEVEAKFDWYGYAVAEWEEDFKSRIAVIAWNERKKSLDSAKKKLDSLISSEGKTSMEIEDLKSALLGL